MSLLCFFLSSLDCCYLSFRRFERSKKEWSEKWFIFLEFTYFKFLEDNKKINFTSQNCFIKNPREVISDFLLLNGNPVLILESEFSKF